VNFSLPLLIYGAAEFVTIIRVSALCTLSFYFRFRKPFNIRTKPDGFIDGRRKVTGTLERDNRAIILTTVPLKLVIWSLRCSFVGGLYASMVNILI
jgi:hypothetical protein